MNRNKPKLSSVFSDDLLAIKLYRQSLKLIIIGKWRDAGDTLMKCANIYIKMKMILEAATLYTEAAETYMKIDKSEALISYKTSIKLYCDIGRFDISGKLEQKIAYINLYAQHWEEAALQFRIAANFLSGDKLLDQSDFCLEKCAECLIEIKNYQEASNVYQTLAKSCVNTNLRRFNAHDHLFMSLLCLMVIPEEISYDIKINPNILISDNYNYNNSQDNNTVISAISQDDTSIINESFVDQSIFQIPLYQTKSDILYNINEQFEKIDYLWRRSKEKLFFRNIIKSFMELDINSFADHLYYYSNIRSFNHIKTSLLKTLLNEFENKIEINRKEKERIEKEALLLEKKEKKRKKLTSDNNSLISSGGVSTSIGSFTTNSNDNKTSIQSNSNHNNSINENKTSINNNDNNKVSINSNNNRTSFE